MADKRPRITRMITWLPVGGIERRLVSVLPRLARRGFDVRLVCLREEGPLAAELRDSGVAVDLIPMRSRLDPRGIPQLSRYLREHRTQVVHAHMYRAMVPGTLASHLAKVPVVFSQIHNVDTWNTRRQKAMDRFLARWRTGTICVSRAVQDDVVHTLGIARDKAPILYNGVDTDLFRPDPQLRSKIRSELEIEDNRTVLLSPARLHWNKTPERVLDAFLSVAPDHPDALLLFAGDGPLRDEMQQRIHAAGAEKRVRLLGSRDDMPALYNAADAMVLSSTREGFSNAVIEALACACPVIASDVGGNREALDSEDVGWLHAEGDGAGLARDLNHALSRPEVLAAMADHCRKRAMDFSLDRLVEETERLYLDGLEAHAKATR